MAELVSRLTALRPVAEKIRTASSATGVSVGVIHDAKVVFTDNFGFRDVENKIPPDQDTIYYLSSLSKSFTAAGIAHLVHQSPQLGWDTPVSKAHPKLSHEDPEIRDRATIVDFLSHRTGLAPKNHIWSQEYGNFSLRRGEDLRTITYLEKIAPFRKRWMYNNWGYAVADELITYLTDRSWGEFLKEHIFDPIGMERTLTKRPQDDDNIAKAYIALSDGEPWELVDENNEPTEPDGEDGKLLEGALSVKSCVRDLLKYYTAFMKAVKADNGEKSLSDSRNPFVEASKMVHPYISLSTESEDYDGSYGLGWVRVRLPCTLGAIGMNHGFVGKMPVVCKGVSKTTCYYHQGSANSFLSSVHLLPETESGVVVLTNSMAQNDVADWLGELYLETLTDSPEKNDYVALAESSAATAIALWPGMRKELAANQIPNTPVRPFHKYVGMYYNRIGNYHIAIFESDGKLLMRFQREKNVAYDLTHYHYDTFSWLITHDRDAKLGRFPITRATFYLIEFDSYGSDKTEVDSLIWIHDDEVLDGERFYKKGGQSDGMIEERKVAPEPVLERRSSIIQQIADEVANVDDGGGEVAVISDDKLYEREVAVVDTVLEDKTQGVVEAMTDVVDAETVPGAPRPANGKL